MRPRKEPPIFPWLLMTNRVNLQSGRQYDFDSLRPVISEWLQRDAEPEWGAYLCGMVSASDAQASFRKGPHTNLIVPVFFIQGIAKTPATKGREVLHRLAHRLLARMNHSVVELHFCGETDTLWLNPA
jgi:hypothetical protein